MSSETAPAAARDPELPGVLHNAENLTESATKAVSSPILIPATRTPKNTPSMGLTPANTDGQTMLEQSRSTEAIASAAAKLEALALDRKAPAATTAGSGLALLQGELQSEAARIEALYREERQILEQKFEELRAQVSRRRAEVVNDSSNSDLKRFWLQGLCNHSTLGQLVTARDQAALELLKDIRCVRNYANNTFTLEFEFGENPFFANQVLTKTYEMQTLMYPLCAEPELLSTTGTEIEWKENMCLTQITKRKKVRRKKKSGGYSSYTKQHVEDCDSFFQWFESPPTLGEVETEEEYELAVARIEMDYEIAQLIMNELVPKAVGFFTGEAVSDDEYVPDEDNENQDEEESNEDEDEDESNPFAPSAAITFPTTGAAQSQEDCKTQ